MLSYKIKRLHAKHFRSISECVVDFDDLTILVGQNAAGKSNVVDAIRFVRDAMADGLDQAVSIRNGIRVVRQVSHSKKPFNVEIRIDYEITKDDYRMVGLPSDLLPATYGFKLSSSNDEVRVMEESGDLLASHVYFDPDGDVFFHYEKFDVFERNKLGVVSVSGEVSKRPVPDDELAMSREYKFLFYSGSVESPANLYDLMLQQSRFAAIYPNVMRIPVASQAAVVLSEDCRNWASVIRSMRKTAEGMESLDKVIRLMRFVLPQLESVTVKNVGGFLVPHFRFSRGGKKRDMDLVPYQLSDGTLRLFGLLLALYQTPPPKFLAVEEPEQMVHPGALRVLADAFNEAKERTQLLITTHSPYFLELFDVDAIRVVSNEGDGTVVGRVSSRQLDILKSRLMTLSEIMVLDGLEKE